MRRINFLFAIAAGPLLCTNPKFPYRVELSADHKTATLAKDGRVLEKGNLRCWEQPGYSWPHFEPSNDLTCATPQPENFYFVSFLEHGEKLLAGISYITESSLNLCTLFCAPKK